MERPDDRAADAAAAREAELLDAMAARDRGARRRGIPTPGVGRAPQSRGGGSGLQRMLAVAAGFLLLAGAVALAANLVSGALSDRGTTIRLVSANGTRAMGQAKVRNTPQGRVAELTVERLSRAPAGSYYECWFVGDGDTVATPNRVSAGTFVVPDAGKHTVELTSAASAVRFPKMGVTVEPDDGNPQRTGAKVLVSVP